MSAGNARDVRDLRRVVVEQGWVVETRRSGHLAWKPPKGSPYFSSATPSDHRALMNLKAALRRLGAAV